MNTTFYLDLGKWEREGRSIEGSTVQKCYWNKYFYLLALNSEGKPYLAGQWYLQLHSGWIAKR